MLQAVPFLVLCATDRCERRVLVSGVLIYSFHWVFGSVYNFYLEAKLSWEKDSEVEFF